MSPTAESKGGGPERWRVELFSTYMTTVRYSVCFSRCTKVPTQTLPMTVVRGGPSGPRPLPRLSLCAPTLFPALTPSSPGFTSLPCVALPPSTVRRSRSPRSLP